MRGVLYTAEPVSAVHFVRAGNALLTVDAQGVAREWAIASQNLAAVRHLVRLLNHHVNIFNNHESDSLMIS